MYLEESVGSNAVPAPAQTPRPLLSGIPVAPESVDASGSSGSTGGAPSTLPQALQDAAAAQRATEETNREVERLREELGTQNAELKERLDALEAELEKSRTEISGANKALEAANQEIARLNEEIAKWKDHVQAIDSEIRLQHESDLQSLDQLSAALEMLIERADPPESEPVETNP